MTAWINLSKKFSLTDWLWELLLFYFTKFWFISIIYIISIFFDIFVLLIFMFFVQVSYTIISFTWWIARTMSLLISFTFLVYLIPKLCRCFFRNSSFCIRYSILFCPFPRVDWFLNRLFSNDRSVWNHFYYFCEEYKEYMVLYLLNNPNVKTNQKDIYCPWPYLFL